MKCPNCNETLLMTHRNNIEIDYCPTCRGVWLDKGELDKMLEFASQITASSSNSTFDSRQGYEENRHHPGYKLQKPYKKKSFLNDFFDFD
ncbi:MAG TPA: zf-TFIIB domain-containing protein [Ferruginibacter sp.]|nr:zf-TFIIB domain-containing protein [Bacteroidota bacterium]MCC6692006.1 zf-TFIIB domain-containing protein [Chitinophagaceae bacterium]HMT96793.1 zf-TFIIB domain-containing protein [Ferruginibacter sp.]MBS1924949.1 zf-TFIIB domain-containing protein [Bacteroidota bacterium]HMU24667.1 zf-TFIIB domain-containing protein [Ferruginibacter sp.]